MANEIQLQNFKILYIGRKKRQRTTLTHKAREKALETKLGKEKLVEFIP